MSTAIWHRGKRHAFEDEDEAKAWLKEIDMARKEKRAPKAPAAKGAGPVEVAPESTVKEFTMDAPAECSLEECGITVGEDNTGGFYVTHRSRGGNLISGTFRFGEDPTAWLERVHAEES